MGEGRATVSSRLLRLGLKEMQVLYLHHKKTHLHSIRLASDNLIWSQINLFTSGQTKRKIKSLEFYKKLVVAGFLETIEEKRFSRSRSYQKAQVVSLIVYYPSLILIKFGYSIYTVVSTWHDHQPPGSIVYLLGLH